MVLKRINKGAKYSRKLPSAQTIMIYLHSDSRVWQTCSVKSRTANVQALCTIVGLCHVFLSCSFCISSSFLKQFLKNVKIILSRGAVQKKPGAGFGLWTLVFGSLL